MNKKILIFTPSYNESSGGAIVLHKLCSILNELGYESYVTPLFHEFDKKTFKQRIKRFFKKFKINPAFNTPVYTKSIEGKDDWIVIYPELVFGNPLKAKNIVRWFLHQPGFHTSKVSYGKGEFYFKFNTAIDDFQYPGSVTSENELKVIHYPLEHFNEENIPLTRSGRAYCLRKGKHKYTSSIHDKDILIDGKSHENVAEIFKKVETFVSYDTYTAYSIFAVLCGAKSIVIPDKGVPETEWYPLKSDRYGISYGFDDIEWADSTKHLVKEHIEREESNNKVNVKRFINEVNQYFI